MKAAMFAILLASCGPMPCDDFSEKFCLLAEECGSVLSHAQCLKETAQWLKNRGIEQDDCIDALEKIESATCAMFGDGSSPGFAPARK